MNVRRLIFSCGVASFAFWVGSLLGYGDLLFWCAFAIVLSIVLTVLAIGVRRRRQWSSFGPDLRYALSVLSSRRRWADLAEIFDLSVDADLRRPLSRRAVAGAVGLTRGDRRLVRYIPVVTEKRRAPYGLAVTVRVHPVKVWMAGVAIVGS